MVDGTVMVLSDVHMLNDCDPMYTECGITISSRDVQLKNAFSRIVLTVGRRVTTERDSHPENELVFMTDTASVMLVNEVQLQNDRHAMSSTDDGIVMSTNEVHSMNDDQPMDLMDDGRITWRNAVQL